MNHEKILIFVIRIMPGLKNFYENLTVVIFFKKHFRVNLVKFDS